MDIYIARGQERNVPYSLVSIQQFLADGVLDGTELLWHEGLAEWTALNQIDGVVIQEASSTQPPLHEPLPMASNNSEAEAAIREALKKPAGELTKADFEKVLKLNLSSTKITDEALKHLTKLNGLSSIGLIWTQITDAGLMELAKLNQLQCLYLDYTKITSDGVAQYYRWPCRSAISCTMPQIRNS